MPTGSRGSSPRTALTAVLVVAGAVRLGFWALGLGDPSEFVAVDSEGYLALANRLGTAYWGDATGDLFTLGLVRPPGYPVLLASLSAFGGSIGFLAFAHVLLGVGVVWATYLLGRSMFDLRVGLVAAAIVALEPASVVHSSLLLTEVPFTLLLVVGALFVWKGQRDANMLRSAVGGGMLGLATLVRPVTVYLPLVLFPSLYLLARTPHRRQGVLTAAVVAVAFATPVGGWMVRNTAVAEVAVISTIESTNLLYYRAASAVAEEDGRSLAEVRDGYLSTVAERLGASPSPASRHRLERSIAVRELLAHPVGTLTMSTKGAGRLLLGPSRAPVAQRFDVGYDHPAVRLFTYATVALLVMLYLLALLGTAGSARVGPRAAIAFLVLLAGYVIVISAGGEAYSRFRVPAVPFVALLGGYAACHVVAPRFVAVRRPGSRLAFAAPRAMYRIHRTKE
ncbi:MAG: glycosyltransferase family 39 protein [Actinobacteria bacterium]|nr:glycosyltransferase family 39 protein [Actinomycetota bacterium]